MKEEAGTRTVCFENFKNRGDVSLEAVYQYEFSEGTSYQARLDSVRSVTDQERADFEKRKQLEAMRERNLEAVEAIKECLRDGVTKKTSLIKEASTRSGISKKKIIRALNDHTGSDISNFQYWHVNTGDNNAHFYQLNYLVEGGCKKWKTGKTGKTENRKYIISQVATA